MVRIAKPHNHEPPGDESYTESSQLVENPDMESEGLLS